MLTSDSSQRPALARAYLRHRARPCAFILTPRWNSTGTGSIVSRLGNIAAETGLVSLCTNGLGPRCIMIGSLTAGQFAVFDIVMDATGAAKFHFHDPSKAAH